MDYSIFYKSSYENGEISDFGEYDLFLSGFDSCERTQVIFDRIKSARKIWVLFPHYQIDNIETQEEIYTNNFYKEDEFFRQLIDDNTIKPDLKICIDITGFIRPHLIFLTKYLSIMGIKKVDYLYTEPVRYKHAEETPFSGFIDDVKIIEGCGSIDNSPKTDNDILIITAGYDDKLIAKVAQYKSKIKHKYYILGLPSLQPDMYQENVLQIYNAKESIGHINTKYAPAHDPFITAQMIHEIIEENKNYSNIYLSPLSTKPQALGIALYYLWNYDSKPVNIIFPYSNFYFSKTASGLKKTWKYTLEFK